MVKNVRTMNSHYNDSGYNAIPRAGITHGKPGQLPRGLYHQVKIFLTIFSSKFHWTIVVERVMGLHNTGCPRASTSVNPTPAIPAYNEMEISHREINEGIPRSRGLRYNES